LEKTDIEVNKWLLLSAPPPFGLKNATEKKAMGKLIKVN
jgi:hypothetical protein